MTTPGPCGCRVEWVYNDPVRSFFIDYCPTHASAPDLLAALKRIDEHARAFPKRPLDEGCVQAVRAAIINAEEESHGL